MVGTAVAGAAAALPAGGGPVAGLLRCPLRTATGVPCPLCGLTTASIALADGRLAEALAANPVVLPLAGATAVMVVVLVLRRLGRLAPARPWGPQGTRRATAATAAAALLSWAGQLHGESPW